MSATHIRTAKKNMNTLPVIALAVAASLYPSAHAVMFLGTADVNYNTTAPEGDSVGKGWLYEGTFGSFQGTAIAPNYFITAKHVTPSVGTAFNYNGDGQTYTVTQTYASPTSDLVLCKVDGAFSTYAPLYTPADGSEVGKSLVMMGRGSQRGAEVSVDGVLKGWQTGTGDGRLRWGENVVTAVESGGAGVGTLLRVSFNNPGVANEATVSPGDSGGGLFIQEGGVWKLAGILHGVEGPFNTTTSGSGFTGAIFDKGGLYTLAGSSWVSVPDFIADRPSAFSAAAISANTDWIFSITAVPEPQAYAAVFGFGLLGYALSRRFIAKQPGAGRR